VRDVVSRQRIAHGLRILKVRGHWLNTRGMLRVPGQTKNTPARAGQLRSQVAAYNAGGSGYECRPRCGGRFFISYSIHYPVG